MNKLFGLILLFFFCSLSGGGNLGMDSDGPSAAAPNLARATQLPVKPRLMPLIYDDDGSPDGTLATLYLLANPDVDLKVISISYGEATPSVYIQHIGNMLDLFDISGITLGAGNNAPLAGSNSFPDWLTESADAFWHMQMPTTGKKYPSRPAADLIISTIQKSPEPITLYFAGAYTSLAQALRDDPTIVNNIEAVYLMGGAVHVPGNIHDFYPSDANIYAEWNIYVDPQAAKEVFESGLDLYLVPLDATNQVLVSRHDTTAWREGGQLADMAADLWDSMISTWSADEVMMWDLTAAIAMMEPQFCSFIPLHLDVVTLDRTHAGQTVVVPGAEPNIAVCLDPQADRMRQHLIEVFANSP